MSRGYTGWEHRLMHEGQSAEKTARHSESTMCGWYRLNRCHGAPDDPSGILSLAERIFAEDFPDLFDHEGDDERYLYEALKEAFRYFDPAKGKLSLPVQWRFTRYFRHVFRRRLAKASKRLRRRKRRARRGWAIPDRPRPTPVEEAYALWAWELYSLALTRLDSRARTYLQLRFGGRKVKEVAAVLGVSPKTLSNVYGLAKLVKQIRREVRAAVLALPDESRRAIVAHLLFEVGLTPDEVGRLLCVPPALAADRLWAVTVPEQEEALRLLHGHAPATQADVAV